MANAQRFPAHSGARFRPLLGGVLAGNEDWPAVGPDPVRSGHLRVRLGQQQFAVGAVQCIKEPVTIGVQQ